MKTVTMFVELGLHKRPIDRRSMGVDLLRQPKKHKTFAESVRVREQAPDSHGLS
jgi:hypothetical protein